MTEKDDVSLTNAIGVPLRALAGDDNKDKVIKDLIETNIRQRGDISSSSLKMGRIICELERIYGIKKGNNQYSEDGRNATTQKDLANKLDIDEIKSGRPERPMVVLKRINLILQKS